MSQSNYKEELEDVFVEFAARYDSFSHEAHIMNKMPYPPLIDALVAIDRLNDEVLGEDEDQTKPKYKLTASYILARNQLRSELRQAFGVKEKEKE